MPYKGRWARLAIAALGHRLATVVGVLLSANCVVPSSLINTPMTGVSTPAQQDVVLSELARFESWIGKDRVTVREIEFADVLRNDEGIGGFWNPTTRRIQLQNGQDGDALTRILRHELCHALDSRERHFDRSVYRRLGQGYVDLPTRRQAREAFADTCEAGAQEAALIVASQCEGESPDAWEATRHQLGEVWTEAPAELQTAELVDWLVTERDAVAPDHWWIEPIDGIDAVRLSVRQDGTVSTSDLDLSTGGELPGIESTPAVDGGEAPYPPHPPGARQFAMAPRFTLAGGPTIAVVQMARPQHQAWWGTRLLVSPRDGDWLAVPNACEDRSQAHAVWAMPDDSMWYAREQSGNVGWTQVFP